MQVEAFESLEYVFAGDFLLLVLCELGHVKEVEREEYKGAVELVLKVFGELEVVAELGREEIVHLVLLEERHGRIVQLHWCMAIINNY